MGNSNYIHKKSEYEGKKTDLNKMKIDGLRIKPKNQISYDAVEVNSMMIVNQNYIEKLLRKKTKRKLDYFLKYIISLIEGEDEDAGNLHLALDDLAHYKSIVEYKYRKYLDEKYVNLLLQKIEMLEHEIKLKLVYVSTYQDEVELEEEKGKTR